jgi:hypothetical protein
VFEEIEKEKVASVPDRTQDWTLDLTLAPRLVIQSREGVVLALF